MLHWLLLAATTWAGSADDATRALSRYPAGQMPADDVVLGALATLAAAGELEHLGLLDSLARHESPAVAGAARASADAIRERKRLDQREAFRSQLPAPSAIAAWAGEHKDAATAAAGRAIGKTELESMAYANLVLHPVARGGAGAPCDAGWASSARAHELAGDPRSALLCFSQAAARGDDDALPEIEAYGVDPERLLLGLTVGEDPRFPHVSPTAIEVLVRHGSTTTVVVLAERAQEGELADQVVALDALGRMLNTVALPTQAKSLAESRLRTATGDARPLIRETAENALGDLGSTTR